MRAFQCAQCMLMFRDRKPVTRDWEPFCGFECANHYLHLKYAPARAAGEMLEALRDAERAMVLDGHGNMYGGLGTGVLQRVRAAIAKAEGKL